MDFLTINYKPGGKCPCVGHRSDADRYYCICCCPSWCHQYCNKGGSYEKREQMKIQRQKLEAEEKEKNIKNG